MAYTPGKNKLFAGVPNALSVSYGGSAAITLYDVTAFDYNFNGTTFENQADDDLWAKNGETHEIGVTIDVTCRDQYAASVLGPDVTIQGLTAVFSGRGAAVTNTKTVHLTDGVVQTLSITGAHGNTPQETRFSIMGFSADGDTTPLSQTLA